MREHDVNVLGLQDSKASWTALVAERKVVRRYLPGRRRRSEVKRGTCQRYRQGHRHRPRLAAATVAADTQRALTSRLLKNPAPKNEWRRVEVGRRYRVTLVVAVLVASG